MGTTNTTSSTQGPAEGGDDRSERGENVLVLDSPTGEAGEAYCAERLTASPGEGSPNALLVTLDALPDRRFDAVVRRGGARPADVGIVCCDETRGAAAASGATDGPGPGPGPGAGPWIATVSSPGDLTGLGVRIEQALSTWAETPAPVELCFHSLTTLLQYVDERAAFRFCHALTRRVDTTGASAHFHLDPAAVDDRTVKTLASLFDRVEDRT